MIQLIVNDEDFLARRHLSRVLKKCVDPATRDFNFERVSARDLSLERLADLCRTPPMMAASRTVVVDDFELLIKKSADTAVDDAPRTRTQKKNAAGADAFMSYLAKPNPETNLILMCRTIDRRSKIFKVLAASGEVHEFKRPYPDRLPDFVLQEAKESGLKISRDVALRLAEFSGPELGTLASEIEKLALFVLPRREITLTDVDALAAEGAAVNIFALGEKLAERDLFESQRLYHRMIQAGEPVVKIQFLLTSHFRRLWLLREALDRRHSASDAELAPRLGVSPFFMKDYRRQVGSLSSRSLNRIYKTLMKTTVSGRLSGLGENALMEDFMIRVCAINK